MWKMSAPATPAAATVLATVPRYFFSLLQSGSSKGLPAELPALSAGGGLPAACGWVTQLTPPEQRKAVPTLPSNAPFVKRRRYAVADCLCYWLLWSSVPRLTLRT